MWSAIKYYSQMPYYLAFAYGHVRTMAQPYISTEFNVHHIEDNVFIGDLASASNVTQLKELGITHIITAVLGSPPQFPDDFKYLHVPVRDIHCEDMSSHLETTTEFINAALAQNGKVFVHCVCGVSRSATIISAWLLAKPGCTNTVDEVIQRMQEKREIVNPIPAFRLQLEEWRSKKQYFN